MKYKNFDSVQPYGYFLVRKSDGLKYIGVRYANVKLNLTPSEDFARVYFTSGKLKKISKEIQKTILGVFAIHSIQLRICLNGSVE